jgi:protein-tyrosine phosphatase
VIGRAGDLIDSLLHPWRRRAARRRLEKIQPHSVLFICHGNICRSPFAAAMFAHAVPRTFARTVTVASAGFVGPGRPPPPDAIATARNYGIDLSRHSSTIVTTENLQPADLVVVMSAAQAGRLSSRLKPGIPVLVLGDLDPLPIQQRTILDPWDRPRADFEQSYARVQRSIDELARILWPGQ